MKFNFILEDILVIVCLLSTTNHTTRFPSTNVRYFSDVKPPSRLPWATSHRSWCARGGDSGRWTCNVFARLRRVRAGGVTCGLQPPLVRVHRARLERAAEMGAGGARA